MKPIRIFDSRTFMGGAKFQTGAHTMPIGPTVVPSGAKSVIVNVTAIDPTVAGYITMWDSGVVQGHSNLNYTPQNCPLANCTPVLLSNREFKIYVSQPVHLVFDIMGYTV
jgi:hypothetical protein